MSHRRPEQVPPGLDNVLRSALYRAVDSVEPAADGLDRIRAKIASGRHAPQLGWRLAAAGYLEPLWRLLGLAGHWLHQAVAAVVGRFRPEAGRADRLGWLRPAAALATGLFVVASASWAIAALPSVMAPSGNTKNVSGQSGGGSGGGVGGRSSSSGPGGGGTVYSSGPGGLVSGSPGSSSPGCTATPGSSGSASTTPSGSPSPSPTGSSGSPSTSPSPSPSPTGSPSTSASPSDSPSTDGATQTPGSSSQATQAVLASRLTGHGRAGAAKGSKPGASTADGSAQTSPAPPSTRPSNSPCR